MMKKCGNIKELWHRNKGRPVERLKGRSLKEKTT
jgi:hypothetical protein